MKIATPWLVDTIDEYKTVLIALIVLISLATHWFLGPPKLYIEVRRHHHEGTIYFSIKFEEAELRAWTAEHAWMAAENVRAVVGGFALGFATLPVFLFVIWVFGLEL
ncbi:hypothetical protein LTR15_010474 [Elasticomyces elasticus]|nr:hypothetical protein LTR15_010474 [Elasticomyces elasticus]